MPKQPHAAGTNKQHHNLHSTEKEMTPPVQTALELRQEITRHNRLYHTLDQPEISDPEYDAMTAELQRLEREHPECRDPDSPTMRVGAEVASGFQEVDHPEPMLGLANASSEEEFDAWHQRMERRVINPYFPMTVEAKVDGLAIRLRYEDGRLAVAATRGNGATGEDVTHNVRTIRNLPLQLIPPRKRPMPEVLELRGEVYLPRSSFLAINQEREEQGEYLYSNPRNAAAGTVRQLDPAVAASRNLRVWIYTNTTPSPGTDSHALSLEELAEMGLPINPLNRACASKEEAISQYRRMTQLKESLDYETDGIVVKMDLLPHQELMGHTGHEPRWAVAWKFPAQTAEADLLRVDVSTGRFGRLTPVAVLSPVEIGGVTISSASLHNENDMRRKDIRPGDRVVVERAGDVIPQVSGPVNTDPGRETKPFEMPELRPACRSTVETREHEVGHWCPNEECASRLPERLKHFVSKQAMDIEHLGEQWCGVLIEKGMVKDPADLYSLTSRQLLTLDRMGERSAGRILRNIEASKDRPLQRVLYSLGIFRLGREVSSLLAERYASLDQVARPGTAELSAIPGIGPKIAASVVRGMTSERVLRTIKGLKEGGVRTEQPDPRMNGNNGNRENNRREMSANEHFEDKTYVVTGKIENMTRQDAENAIRTRGGNTASSVTSKTDVLVVGEKPGSKLAKARQLGVTIMEQEEFFRMLNG